MPEQDLGQALDWDMNEVDDQDDYVLIEPGVYGYIVASLKKERFEGSDKMAPCPKAVVTLSVVTDSGMVPVSENLMLNTKMMFKISQFFKSLGAKPDPETGKVPVDWSNVVGKEGQLEIERRTYTKKDGSQGEANSVKRFLAPEEASSCAPQQTSMPVPDQPAAAKPSEVSQYGYAM